MLTLVIRLSHGLQMWRWSFQVCSSYVTPSSPDSLSRSGKGVSPGLRSWKSTILFELNVRKPFVVSIPQRSEKLSSYNLLVQNMSIWNPGFKSVSSNASPGRTVRFLWVIIEVFWKMGSRPNLWYQLRLLTRELFFCLHIFSLWVNDSLL